MIVHSSRPGQGLAGFATRRWAGWWARWGRWPVWQLTGVALVLVVGVDVLAVVVAVRAVAGSPLSGAGVLRWVVLAGLGAGDTELVRRVPRLRRYVGGDRLRANHQAVWIVAGLLTMPAGYVVVLVVVLYAHHGGHEVRDQITTGYRVVFSTAAVLLAAVTAATLVPAGTGWALADTAAGLAATAGAVGVFTAINLGLVAAAIVIATRPPRWRAAWPGGDDWVTETATLVLAVMTAELLVHTPAVTPAVLVLIVALRRGTLVKHLETLAASDTKTGLLNATAWHHAATTSLHRTHATGGQAAVLVIDLDHFKTINDTHGHPAGDIVIRAVADLLTTTIRPGDHAGRYGGEEFILYLASITLPAAEQFATRLTHTIRALHITTPTTPTPITVTASTGIAHTPTHATTLTTLIHHADTAMYTAKHHGRNQTKTAATTTHHPPAPSSHVWPRSPTSSPPTA